MNNKLIVIGSVILGFIFLIVSFEYFTVSANHLPHFFLGYSPTITRHHYTHGVGTLILGVGLFIFAWFQSGKKSSKTDAQKEE